MKDGSFDCFIKTKDCVVNYSQINYYCEREHPFGGKEY
jgi:hypothetical protein